MAFNILVVGGAEPGRVTREILDHAGYTVREAVSLDEAAVDVLGDPPLAVVVGSPAASVAMPFVARLRNDPATGDIPVLVLGGDTDDCGCADFVGTSCIPEPYSARWLLLELAHLTRPRGSRGSPTDQVDRK
jgi:CheY-like chemotaxis protein